MNIDLVLRTLGLLMLFLSAGFLPPLAISILYQDGMWWVFLLSASLSALAGTLCFVRAKPTTELMHRDAFVIVTFGWALFAVFGCIPYLLAGVAKDPASALFESMSGFTTTGATVFVGLDNMPKSILFWRALTHWIGGMGIIVLGLAILPMLGVGGMKLFEAETSGPIADKLTPRLQDTANRLLMIYLGLTGMETLLLWLFGFGPMNLFDAACHSMATIATGGFSTKDASVAAFDSVYAHYVITLFMFVSGVNFTLHYLAILCRGMGPYSANSEFRAYAGFCAGAVGVCMAMNLPEYGWDLERNFRHTAFSCLSIVTSTGFAVVDYENWSALSQFVMVALTWVGACAGSTSGGMKVIRIVILWQYVRVQISRHCHPRQVMAVKIDRKTLPPDVIEGVLGFIALYATTFIVATFLVVMTVPAHAKPDGKNQGEIALVSAGSAVITCMSNVGPGLGDVGPMDNFTSVNWFGKLILTFCMLVGRLEVYTVFVLFVPSFWRQ